MTTCRFERADRQRLSGRWASRHAGLLAFLASLGAAAATPATTAADSAIVAGKRIDAIEIGMRRTQVEKLLGKADSEHVQSPHRTNAVWPVVGKGQLHAQFVDGVVARVATGARQYATSDGIAAGASMETVRALHPQTSETDYAVRRGGGAIAVQCHDDVAAGIGFEFDKGAAQRAFVLRSIYVHARGKATPCGREDDPRATRKVSGAPG